MEIVNLSHDERIALVGLMEAVAMSDGILTEGEEQGISQVAVALGDEAYRKLLEVADARFASVDDLKTFLATVERQESRELIYGTAWEEAAAAPGGAHRDTELLQWVADAWGIQVEPGVDSPE